MPDFGPTIADNEFVAHSYVEEFVGPELYEEIQSRIDDGQQIGYAIVNAGDHADKVWSWAPGWSDLSLARTWKSAALWLQNWGAAPETETEERWPSAYILVP